MNAAQISTAQHGELNQKRSGARLWRSVCPLRNTPPLVWATSAHAKHVDVAINETARIVTGCLKPTPVSSLYPLIGVAPPSRNRLRTGVARCKTNLLKWGMSGRRCDVFVWPAPGYESPTGLPRKKECTHEDLILYNDKGIAAAVFFTYWSAQEEGVHARRFNFI
ncbi:hypothetical protein QE152_g13420 [Popillia japonica]|uniref:Uncharacterized protein n=1 Tax=Popillia japonica TaxID=7064 RepID=A0AAW1L9N3_POPJA